MKNRTKDFFTAQEYVYYSPKFDIFFVYEWDDLESIAMPEYGYKCIKLVYIGEL